MRRDTDIKLARVRRFLQAEEYTGMVLSRQDNFSWITGGGSNRVIIPSEEGAGVIVVTQDQIYMVAQVMDGQRIMDEEMSGLDARYIPLKWYEESAVQRAVALAGEKPVADIAAGGCDCRLREIYALHFPLTDSELAVLTELGSISDRILTDAAAELKPGMTDYEVEAMLLYEYAKKNIQCDVLLVGTDERIFRYRHPNPSGAKVGEYILLHSAARMRGLHCNVTRSVYFGNRLPERIERAYAVAGLIEANCMSLCSAGVHWNDILKDHKRILREYGFADEWRNHYPGGRTGYFVCQADLSLDPENQILNREAYDWFITVTGAKVEELSVNIDGDFRILSNTGLWPSLDIERRGRIFSIPGIMMR